MAHVVSDDWRGGREDGTSGAGSGEREGLGLAQPWVDRPIRDSQVGGVGGESKDQVTPVQEGEHTPG